MYLKIILLPALLAVAFLAGCAQREMIRPEVLPTEKAFTESGTKQLDFTDDLDHASLLLATERSINYYNGAGRNRIFRIAGHAVSATRMKETLTAFREILQSDANIEQKKKRIADEFLVIPAAGENGGILFTGYYEPLLEGSLVQTEKYKYPLYRPPPDILPEDASINKTKSGRMIPYYTRREIDIDGVLRGRNLELLWVSDPVELNSLHTQGSGKIRLENGKMLTVSFAQSNGRPFSSVTLYMLDQNKITKSETTYRGFKTWLKGKSDKEIFEILSHNERYIFFRFVNKEPVGALGEPVTPDRTIAADMDYYPAGALAFIRLRKPVLDDDDHVISRTDFSRFVLNQDKGAAIKGPGRIDLFCGFGPKAQATAGSLKENGELYFLLIK